MKRFLVCVLLILYFSSASYAGSTLFFRGTGAAGPSCPGDGSPDYTLEADDYDYSIGNIETKEIGGTSYTFATGRQICKIGFRLTASGTISGFTYYAKIWTTDGNNLGSIITNGTSSGVTGDNGWSDSWVYFSFSNNPSVAAAKYYLTVDRGAYSDPNHIIFTTATQSAGGAEDIAAWYANGSIGSGPSTDYDGNIKLFYYD